jgi:hypothetical protein
MGEGRSAPGGVLDHGTQEEDGPGTWEVLAFLEKRLHRGRPSARGTGAAADGVRESEGCKVA